MDYLEMYGWLVILLGIAFFCGYKLGSESARPKRDEKGRFAK